MSNGVLLAIVSCKKDNQLVADLWPWFMRSKADEVVGCGTVDDLCVWPSPIRTLNTGAVGLKPLAGTRNGTSIWGLCQQELDILTAFLQTDHHSCAVVESDNVILKPFQRHPTKLLLSPLLPNLQPNLFSAPQYTSTPRWYCREVASHILHHGTQLLKSGESQGFCSDRFIAACAFRARIRMLNYGYSSYPLLGPGDHDHLEVFIRDARAAILVDDCPTLHGVKSLKTLERILKGTKYETAPTLSTKPEVSPVASHG